MQPIVLEDFAGKLSMATLPIHKAPYGFFGGGGNESSRKVNLCLWWCLSLYSDVEHREVETRGAVSWAWLLLVMPPARVQVTSQMVFSCFLQWNLL